jgi:3-oxoadipate enol-lactonase
MTELIVAGEAFNVFVEGRDDAPVLMLSNSLGTNLHMWDRQIETFKERFRVVRYDARGHGRSVVTEGPYSIAELGRDALAIMDTLGFKKVHWLGLSMGGMVGQWLLIHAPERIDRAVLANTSAQTTNPDLWNDRIRTVHENGMQALGPSVMERWFTKDFRDTQSEEVASILGMLEATPAVGYAASCAAIRDMDQLADLYFVDNSTLVIIGSQDPATPPEMGAQIANAIPGAKLVTLDTAHLSNIEDTEHFNKAVVEFLTAKLGHQVAEAPDETAEVKGKISLEDQAIVANGHLDETEFNAPESTPAPKKPRRKPAPRQAPAAEDEQNFAPREESSEPDAAIGIEAPLPEAEEEPVVVKKSAVVPVRSAPRRRPVKKAAAKRASTRASTAKKAPAKKAATKKTAARKAAAKKSVGRTTARKTAAGRAAAKKTPARKVATRKSAVRKAVTKKTAAKRAAAKKVVAKKVVAKKVVPKKLASRKLAVKKSPAKKSLAKKTVVKKVVKKSTAKKSVRKTSTRRVSARRTPSRKR